MEKTREWVKDLALIVGHSVKSGVGRGQPHDEEQPLLPERAHNPRVSHAALAYWKSTSPCSLLACGSRAQLGTIGLSPTKVVLPSVDLRRSRPFTQTA